MSHSPPATRDPPPKPAPPPVPPRAGDDGGRDGGSEDELPNVRYIEACKVTVTAVPGGTYRSTIEGDRSILRVAFARAFPISAPDRYIEIRDGSDDGVGMLKDLEGMDAESARQLIACLEQQYFQPQVLEIYEVREEFGNQFWSIRTDRGDVDFYVKDARKNLQMFGSVRLRITDIDNNIYEVPDVNALDPESHMRLDRVI